VENNKKGGALGATSLKRRGNYLLHYLFLEIILQLDEITFIISPN